MNELFNIWLGSTAFPEQCFRFCRLAFEEMAKYNKSHFVGMATKLVHKIDKSGFNR